MINALDDCDGNTVISAWENMRELKQLLSGDKIEEETITYTCWNCGRKTTEEVDYEDVYVCRCGCFVKGTGEVECEPAEAREDSGAQRKG